MRADARIVDEAMRVPKFSRFCRWPRRVPETILMASLRRVLPAIHVRTYGKVQAKSCLSRYRSL